MSTTRTDLFDELAHAFLGRESDRDLGDLFHLASTLLLRRLQRHLAGGEQAQNRQVVAVGVLGSQRRRHHDRKYAAVNNRNGPTRCLADHQCAKVDRLVARKCYLHLGGTTDS